MYVNIIISSKNKTSLSQFVKLLHLLMFFKTLNLKSCFNYVYKKKDKKIITILKSPHVNKTSQEQFEYVFFSNKINITSFQIFKILMILKKIQKVTGFDIIIKLKLMINSNKRQMKLHPKNHIIKFQKIKNNFCKNSLNHYFKLFDAYGCLKNSKCLNSSVGRAKD